MSENKEINLCNDIIFKYIVQSDEARDVVITFLQHITSIPREELEKAKFVSAELPKMAEKEKLRRVDILVQLKGGDRIIVEMNGYNSENIFAKNAQYAFAQNLTNTPPNVKKYPKTMIINIDNFNKFKDKDAVLPFYIQDGKGHIETELYVSYHFILANAVSDTYNKDEELKKFAKFLKCKTIKELEQFGKENEEYMSIYERIRKLLDGEELLDVYDKEQMHEEEIAYSRKEGEECGIAIGEERGIAIGEERGIAIGKSEEKTEIARNLKKLNIPISDIMKATGLSIKEIKML